MISTGLSQHYQKFFFGCLCFYAIALTTSIAGMELLGSLMMALVLYLAVSGFFIKSHRLALPRFCGDTGLWLFVFFAALGAMGAQHLDLADKLDVVRSARFAILIYALIFAISWQMEKDLEKIKKILRLLFVFMLIVGVYGIVQFFTGIDIFRSRPYELKIFEARPDIHLYRVKGFFTNTMSFSYAFGMLFCLLLSLAFFNTGLWRRKWLKWFSVAVVLLSLGMTFTRGLWITLLVALSVMTAFYSRKVFLRFLFSSLLLAALLFTFSPPVRERFMGLVQLDQSNFERTKIWRVHFEMFKDHPWLGVGYEKNRVLVQNYNEKLWGHKWRGAHAHNHFLQILAGTGVLGFISFMIFVGGGFYMALMLWRRSQQEDNDFFKAIALGSIGAQIVCHLGGMSESVFVDRESNHVFIFILALTISSCMYLKFSKQSLRSDGTY